MKKFRQWLRDFLGISMLITKVHNIEGDVDSIVIKQLDEIDPLPVDPPECNENSPYEYLTEADPVCGKSGWYAFWQDGFAGPFPSYEEADQYAEFNKLDDRHDLNISELRKYGLAIK